MNHDSEMSHESDLRALPPETLSDATAFALVEALYATVGAGGVFKSLDGGESWEQALEAGSPGPGTE